MKLWLDDIRAAPEGWTWIKTAAEARCHLANGVVEYASLDHDLGDACARCWTVPGAGIDDEVKRTVECDGGRECRCECHEDGSSLVRWMAETGHWPRNKPRVHSANPVGAEYMRGVIERYFQSENR